MLQQGGFVRRERDEEEPGMMMTPMIDMVFLLLIFFLVTASLKKPHKELKIQLPAAGYAKLAKYSDQVVITMAEDGTPYLDDGKTYRNQAPVSREELMTVFQDISNTDKNTPIRLDIDRRIRYFHLMELMDMLELYQLHNVQFRSQHGFADEHE